MNLGKPNVIKGAGAGRMGMHPFQGMRPGMDRCGTEYIDRKILVSKTKIRRSFGVQKKLSRLNSVLIGREVHAWR